MQRLLSKLLKYAIYTLAAIVAITIVALFLLPMERYIPEAESIVSVLVERPVKINGLNIDLFPLPHLNITGLTIGSQSEVTLEDIEVQFNVSALLNRQCSISQILINHGVLTEKPVSELFEWLMSPTPAIEEPVYCRIQQLDFKNIRLDVAEMPLDAVSGVVLFSRNNDPSLISLHIPQFNLTADVTPKPDGSFHIQASTPGWGLPDIPDMKLEKVLASGNISDTGFDIQELTGTLMGVSLHGKGLLNWEPEWKLQGELSLSGTKVKHEIISLDGRTIGFSKLLGHGVFHSHGASPDDLINSLAFDADIKSSDFSLEIEPHAVQPLILEQFNTHISYTIDAIRLQQMEAKLAGGTLTGAMTLLPATSIFRFDLSPQGVNPQAIVRAVDNSLVLSGTLSGTIKGSINLDHLTDFPQKSNIDGTFDITQGELGESRLVTAVNSNIPKTEENRIKFEHISSNLLVDDSGYHFSKLQIIASVFNAEGDLNISANEQLDGVLEADLKGMAGLISLPLRVTGSLDNPTVRPTGGVVAGAAIGTALLGPVGTAIGIRAGSLIDRAWKKTDGLTNSTPTDGKPPLNPSKRVKSQDGAQLARKHATEKTIDKSRAPQLSLPALPD